MDNKDNIKNNNGALNSGPPLNPAGHIPAPEVGSVTEDRPLDKVKPPMEKKRSREWER